MATDLDERARVIADALEGTCDAPPDELFEVEGLAEKVDELVFECEECGWWFELAEMAETDVADESICQECGGDL